MKDASLHDPRWTYDVAIKPRSATRLEKTSSGQGLTGSKRQCQPTAIPCADTLFALTSPWRSIAASTPGRISGLAGQVGNATASALPAASASTRTISA